MKFLLFASSILFTSSLFLVGCDSLGLPDVTRHDEVPAQVKAQPRLVESPPPEMENAPWPRLGDVPFMPHDFSPKPVYGHYMNELEYDRAVAEDARDKLEQENAHTPDASSGVQTAPLAPPHMPAEP